jgi:hypothetical protein
MADTTTSTTTNTTTTPATAAKPAAKKPAARKRPARKPAPRRTTSRSATATSPSKSTGRRVRTQARGAAKANVRAARTTAEQGKSLVERAALTYVGATLEARDRVFGAAGTVADTFGTRKKAERELKKLQARYERRGTTSRNRIEREAKKARTRLERVVRRNRAAAERDAASRPNVVSEQLAGVSTRVEEAAQVGVAAAQRVGTIAKDRIAAIA